MLEAKLENDNRRTVQAVSSAHLILSGYDQARIERWKRDLPEIPCRPDELDACRKPVVVGGLHIDDAAILMFLGATVGDAETLSDGNGRAEKH